MRKNSILPLVLLLTTTAVSLSSCSSTQDSQANASATPASSVQTPVLTQQNTKPTVDTKTRAS